MRAQGRVPEVVDAKEKGDQEDGDQEKTGRLEGWKVGWLGG
jgi:hypothetical protein